jgi:AraC-like DNA-binding protein
MNFSLAYSPLAYFHIKSITNISFKVNRRFIIHFVPCLLIEVVFFIVFFTYTRFHMEWAYANIEQIRLLFLLIGMGTCLQMSAYAFFMWRLIRETTFRPDNYTKIIKNWLRTFGILWSLLIAFLASTILTGLLNLKRLDELPLQYPLSVLASFSIYWLGYRYLLKYNGSIQKHIIKSNAIRYSHEEIDQKKRQLIEALEVHLLYKDINLDVEGLAKHLKWPIRDIPLVISEGFGTNFNDLINSYRIEAFKKMVSNSENRKYTIMALAQKAGFNSRASFYRAFKKIHGQTPGEFFDHRSGK